MSTGEVDSATGRCAIQPRGSARSRSRSAPSSAGVARGPMTMPAPPAPSTGLTTSWSRCAEHPVEHVRVVEAVGLHVVQ